MSPYKAHIVNPLDSRATLYHLNTLEKYLRVCRFVHYSVMEFEQNSNQIQIHAVIEIHHHTFKK